MIVCLKLAAELGNITIFDSAQTMHINRCLVTQCSIAIKRTITHITHVSTRLCIIAHELI